MVDSRVGFEERGGGWLWVGLRVVHGLGMGRHGVHVILMELPDFCVKNPEQEFVAGDAGEARSGEGRLRIGKVGDAQAGEDAEGQVERADVERGEGAEDGSLRNGEVGEEPEGTGSGLGGEVLGEAGEFGLGEAVEEEMSDDEVGVGSRSDGEGRGLEGADAVEEGLAAAAEESEHGGAGIDGQGTEVWPAIEEPGEETAVPVTEDERLVAGREIGEKMSAGALQERAEGKVFGEAIDAGYRVEIGGSEARGRGLVERRIQRPLDFAIGRSSGRR
jgi:hypothetical protein